MYDVHLAGEHARSAHNTVVHLEHPGSFHRRTQGDTHVQQPLSANQTCLINLSDGKLPVLPILRPPRGQGGPELSLLHYPIGMRIW